MRLALLFILTFAACTSTLYDAGVQGGDDGFDGAANQCNVASDCVAAAAKCCDCPTYAVPRSDPAINACAGVTCPPGTACPMNVAPACNAEHMCELACVAMTCATSCDDGYVVDANGCLSCECAMVGARECLADTSCAETPADCCGCANGGVDTSVPSDQVAIFQSELNCSPNPSCPGNNTCNVSAAPACVQGACALVDPLPADACGRTDLPPCGNGTICTVNLAGGHNPANDHRVGQCVPSPP